MGSAGFLKNNVGREQLKALAHKKEVKTTESFNTKKNKISLEQHERGNLIRNKREERLWDRVRLALKKK